MKRVAYLAVLLLIVGGIPFAMNAGPNPNPDKTSLCHFDDEGVGHVINVSENALPAHLDKHGDCRVDGDDFIDNGDGTCSCNVPITYTITLQATEGSAFGETAPATFTGTFVVPSSFLAQADGFYPDPPIQDFTIQIGSEIFSQDSGYLVEFSGLELRNHEIYLLYLFIESRQGVALAMGSLRIWRAYVIGSAPNPVEIKGSYFLSR